MGKEGAELMPKLGLKQKINLWCAQNKQRTTAFSYKTKTTGLWDGIGSM